MLKIIYKNMSASSLTTENVEERIAPILDKYPALRSHRATLTIEMENSPFKRGLDSYALSLMVTGKTYKNLRIKKSAENLYAAAAALAEGLTELLGREHGRRHRATRRTLRLQEAI